MSVRPPALLCSFPFTFFMLSTFPSALFSLPSRAPSATVLMQDEPNPRIRGSSGARWPSPGNLRAEFRQILHISNVLGGERWCLSFSALEVHSFTERKSAFTVHAGQLQIPAHSRRNRTLLTRFNSPTLSPLSPRRYLFPVSSFFSKHTCRAVTNIGAVED